MQIAQEYQGRSYSIAVGLDLNAVRNKTVADVLKHNISGLTSRRIMHRSGTVC